MSKSKVCQWEYYVLESWYGMNIEKELNRLGAEGWEVIALIPGGSYSTWDGSWQGLTLEDSVVIFKREKLDGKDKDRVG